MIHLALLDVIGDARQGKLEVTLTNAQGGDVVGRTAGGMIVRPKVWTTGTDGVLDFAPIPNSDITPPNSYYTAVLNGNPEHSWLIEVTGDDVDFLDAVVGDPQVLGEAFGFHNLADAVVTGDEPVGYVWGKISDDPARYGLVAAGSGSGIVESIVAGTGIDVDATDPANPIVTATGTGGAAPSPSLFISGRYTATSTDYDQQQPSADRLLFVPIVVPRSIEFDQIAVYHGGGLGSAGSVARLGIYANHATDDKPDALIVDAGTIATDTAIAIKGRTLTLTLDAGLYWLAMVSQITGGAPTFAVGFSPFPVPSQALSVGAEIQNGVTGALPSVAASTANQSGPGPIFYLHAA